MMVANASTIKVCLSKTTLKWKSGNIRYKFIFVISFYYPSENNDWQLLGAFWEQDAGRYIHHNSIEIRAEDQDVFHMKAELTKGYWLAKKTVKFANYRTKCTLITNCILQNIDGAFNKFPGFFCTGI